MKSRAIAVVGTDTGVGKTCAARSLLDHLIAGGSNCVALKPFVTGEVEGRWSDLDRLDVRVSSETGPARYRLPLSPYGAIRRGEQEAPLDRVFAHIASTIELHDVVVIEGIGGVLVPLVKGVTWLDLHARHRWPAIVVARAGLGTINHSLLTIDALRSRDIPIAGFVLAATTRVAEADAEENAFIITEFSGADCLGIVPFEEDDVKASWDRHVDWDRVALPSKELTHAAR
ncbi:MAG: dethiobiotin synthase [Candidatus Hydrogenedentota bacterium]